MGALEHVGKSIVISQGIHFLSADIGERGSETDILYGWSHMYPTRNTNITINTDGFIIFSGDVMTRSSEKQVIQRNRGHLGYIPPEK